MLPWLDSSSHWARQGFIVNFASRFIDYSWHRSGSQVIAIKARYNMVSHSLWDKISVSILRQVCMLVIAPSDNILLVDWQVLPSRTRHASPIWQSSNWCHYPRPCDDKHE